MGGGSQWRGHLTAWGREPRSGTEVAHSVHSLAGGHGVTPWRRAAMPRRWRSCPRCSLRRGCLLCARARHDGRSCTLSRRSGIPVGTGSVGWLGVIRRPPSIGAEVCHKTDLDELAKTDLAFVALGAHAFSSRLSSFRKRQSVPSAMIFCGLDLIKPTSCRRSAQNRIVSSGSYSRHLSYGLSFRVCSA